MTVSVKIDVVEGKELAVYDFNVFDNVLVFVAFKKQYKPEGKRVWKTEVLWDKYNVRDSKLKHVELPENVRELAKDEFIKSISVKTWVEYKPTDN